jgi:hypothetical protein
MKKTITKYQKQWDEFQQLHRKDGLTKRDFQQILRYKYNIPFEMAGLIYDFIKFDEFDMFKDCMQNYDNEIAEDEKMKRESEKYREEREQQLFEDRQEKQRMRNNIYDMKELLKAILEELKK